VTPDRTRRLTVEETRPAIDHYVHALARGDYPCAEAAAKACRAELCRLHRRRPVLSVFTLTDYIREQARPLHLSYAKARWSPEDERVVRRYARALVRGQYTSGRRAAADCQHKVEQLGLRTKRATEPRRPFYGYYWKLRALAQDVGMPYVKLPWTRDEKRILDRYVRRLFAGRYRRTLDAAEPCARELAGLRRTPRKGADVVNDRVRPRGTRTVYRELTHRVARLHLPRYKAEWTPPELSILEKCARRVGQGVYPSWKEAARASWGELKELYSSIGRKSAAHTAGLRGRDLPAIEQRLCLLSRQLSLRGPRNKFWSAAEQRVLDRWVRLYHRNRAKMRQGSLHDAANGLCNELRGLGSRRRLTACRDKLLVVSRTLYGPVGPSPRPWAAAEDRVCDSWVRWYDHHRRTRRLQPLTESTVGMQEELDRMGSNRSLNACKLRLLSRHKRLLGLA